MRESLESRFWRKVEKTEGGCWEWIARRNQWHYGQFTYEGRTQMAHRLAWAWANGRDIPAGLVICHRCDNPACVNPSHLFLGSKADNNHDRNAKGRQARGEGQWCAKVTEDDVRAIRADLRPQHQIAASHGLTQATVNKIKRGKTWAHVAGHYPKEWPALGERNGQSKVTAAQVLAIRADPRSGPKIAAQYGISHSLVSQIKRRVIWNHI